MARKADGAIDRVRVEGERRIIYWEQYIRFNPSRGFETMPLPNCMWAASNGRWTLLKLNDWIGPQHLSDKREIKEGADFLRALAWLVEGVSPQAIPLYY